jgi:hypothetical protein
VDIPAAVFVVSTTNIAIGILVVDPAPARLERSIECIDGRRSAFETYCILNLITALMPALLSPFSARRTSVQE